MPRAPSYIPSRKRPSTTSARSFTAPRAPKSSTVGRGSSRGSKGGGGGVTRPGARRADTGAGRLVERAAAQVVHPGPAFDREDPLEHALDVHLARVEDGG